MTDMGNLPTRGLRDGDDTAFSPVNIEKLKTAQVELSYLLDRGYPIKSAGTLIGNHHQLSARQLLALFRSTSATKNIVNRENKRLAPDALTGQTVYIDGFNVIITLEVALSNGMLFVGQDGCVRDLAELRGTYRLIPQTETAIHIIRNMMITLHVAKVVFMLDEPVSNSGRLKTRIYDIDWPIPVEVRIIRNPDEALKRLPCVITSDAIILDACESWLNLMAYWFVTSMASNELSRLIYLCGKEEMVENTY